MPRAIPRTLPCAVACVLACTLAGALALLAGCTHASSSPKAAVLRPAPLSPAPLTLESFAIASSASEASSPGSVGLASPSSLPPAHAIVAAPASASRTQPTVPPTVPPAAPAPLSTQDVTAEFTPSTAALNAASQPASQAPSSDPRFAAIRSTAWVDEVVGNINGKPVYASVFLLTGSPTVTALGPRLQREADLRSRNDWLNFATREITRAVNSFVEDELLRAEAIASLKPEEKQGLFAFIDRAQRELERQSGGSRAAAEQRLLDEKGITLDEWRRQREDLELIRFELSNRIFQRISVARRDIALRYQQLDAELNKPPLATFRLIQAAKDSPADIDTITQLLAAQGFEAAARSKANLNKPAEAGLEPRELTPPQEGKDPVRLFANPKLDEAARALAARVAAADSAGSQTVGPIELTASIAWLRLDAIEDRSTTLYDAQLSVEEDLRSQRVERERGRFIRKLAGRASDETIRDIVLRLLEVASQRYYPPTKAEPAPRPQRSPAPR